MKKENQIFLAGLLVAVTIFFYRENNKSDVFYKNQECTKSTSILKKRIEESGRVFAGETYTFKELFYNSGVNDCVYGYIINSPVPIYNIETLSGRTLHTGSLENEYYSKISKLRNN